MTNIGEAQGIALAAKAADMPCVISFTVETDGRLPTGDTLAEAIESVDEATGNGPAYYMINCAHPTHFDHVLDAGGAWIKRIRGTTRQLIAAEPRRARQCARARHRRSARARRAICRAQAAASLISMCLAAAAAPTTAMWTASAPPAAARLDARFYTAVQCPRKQMKPDPHCRFVVHVGPVGGRLGPHGLQTWP